MTSKLDQLSIIFQENLYEQDFYLWILLTANQIREGKFDAVDWENVLEELESLGRSDKRELRNRLIVLLEHLLKLAYWKSEKEANAKGWLLTITEQRRQIKVILKDSPSLKPFVQEIFVECYQDAVKNVAISSGLNLFPTESPFTQEDTFNPDWIPE
ncbi:MAG TPA: DUF29 domain-containing protein [Oculatellaceae cyanobacterium]|jgi:hypothetical protein